MIPLAMVSVGFVSLACPQFWNGFCLAFQILYCTNVVQIIHTSIAVLSFLSAVVMLRGHLPDSQPSISQRVVLAGAIALSVVLVFYTWWLLSFW